MHPSPSMMDDEIQWEQVTGVPHPCPPRLTSLFIDDLISGDAELPPTGATMTWKNPSHRSVVSLLASCNKDYVRHLRLKTIVKAINDGHDPATVGRVALVSPDPPIRVSVANDIENIHIKASVSKGVALEEMQFAIDVAATGVLLTGMPEAEVAIFGHDCVYSSLFLSISLSNTIVMNDRISKLERKASELEMEAFTYRLMHSVSAGWAVALEAQLGEVAALPKPTVSLSAGVFESIRRWSGAFSGPADVRRRLVEPGVGSDALRADLMASATGGKAVGTRLDEAMLKIVAGFASQDFIQECLGSGPGA